MSMWIFHCFIIIVSFHLIYAQTETVQDGNYSPASKLKVNGIVDKINSIVKDIQFKSTHESKAKLLETIETKLIKAAKFLGPHAKKNVQLIMEGIRIKTSNITDNARKSQNTINIQSRQKTLNELSLEFDLFIKNKLAKSTTQNKNTSTSDIKYKNEFAFKNSLEHNNNTRRAEKLFSKDEYSRKKLVSNDKDYFKSPERSQSRTANKAICKKVLPRICSDVKLLNSFKCQYVDEYVPLEDLCNNYIDCPDRSDEKYCIRHVTNKVEQANRVMSDVESSFQHKCLEMDQETSVFRRHSQVLQGLLGTQMKFKEKYQNLDKKLNSDDTGFSNTSDSINIKRSVNDIAIIISSLSLTLKAALCSQQLENQGISEDVFERNLEQDVKEVIWPPKSCACKRELCIKCTDACKRICWHKHSLSRWNCESINVSDSVSFNVLCDGKIDCFDESDEAGCDVGAGYGKFEAHEIYGNTIKMLQSKASKEISPIRVKIMSLINAMTKLQEMTTKSGNDLSLVKKLRNKCFSLLSLLYLDIVKQSRFVNESEEAYLFLMSINKNLALALKRSATGNIKIINEKCYCRNGSCVVSLCPRSCVKSCSAESKIINFRCHIGNVSVSIDNICDGRPNCPNGYDEFGCHKEEVCRQHHLIMLRRRLQDVEKKFKGTSLGEILASWKVKVISIIKVAENSGRPKPRIIRKIVKEILRDLVLTYGSVEDYRRSNYYALDDFINIAQQVMNAMKSCGK
ncbi:uncharacterized protein LOC116769100 [Danaus plexippus]|uniref:uncharacterized protein LOC116769100 n=1 Tax=Danaus plexippus TaxID=13037 RepID=UPI002AB11AF1|nr:uncharacterized protein LOC116769100 [Danaus plexippus]